MEKSMSTKIFNSDLWGFDPWGQNEPTQLEINRAKVNSQHTTNKKIVYGSNVLTPRKVADPKVYQQYPFISNVEEISNDRDFRMNILERKSGKRHKYYAKQGEVDSNLVKKYHFKRGDRVLHYKVGDVEECTLEWCINNANQPWNNRNKEWHNEHRTLPTLAKEANISEEVLESIIELDFNGTHLHQLLMEGKV